MNSIEWAPRRSMYSRVRRWMLCSSNSSLVTALLSRRVSLLATSLSDDTQGANQTFLPAINSNLIQTDKASRNLLHTKCKVHSTVCLASFPRRLHIQHYRTEDINNIKCRVSQMNKRCIIVETKLSFHVYGSVKQCSLYNTSMCNKKFELMLKRCAKAYSSSGSVV